MIAEYNVYNPNYKISIKGILIEVDRQNDRLLIKDSKGITDDIIFRIIDFAKIKNFGKIIVYCQKDYILAIKKAGFVAEGSIKGYYQGIDAFFLSYFIGANRRVSKLETVENNIISESLKAKNKYLQECGNNYQIRNATEKDISQMISLFREVFESYPSPVNNAEYLRDVMKKKVLFKVAEEDGRIIGIASADMDINNLNAEITDCATHPNHRGRGILPNLIVNLEKDLIGKGFVALFSLSRASNSAINKTLSKLGYEYSGRLINNCHICGDFEDMNIWVKLLKN